MENIEISETSDQQEVMSIFAILLRMYSFYLTSLLSIKACSISNGYETGSISQANVILKYA